MLAALKFAKLHPRSLALNHTMSARAPVHAGSASPRAAGQAQRRGLGALGQLQGIPVTVQIDNPCHAVLAANKSPVPPDCETQGATRL